MAHPIAGRRPAPARRLGVCLGLAAALLTGTLAVPAGADVHPDSKDGKGNGAHNPPARQQFAQRDHGRENHHHYNYRRGPDIYQTAPPVIYAPPGYYQQPGPELNLYFPLFR